MTVDCPIPAVERAIGLSRDGQVGWLVWEGCGERFVDLDAEAGLLAGMHEASIRTYTRAGRRGRCRPYAASAPGCRSCARSNRSGGRRPWRPGSGPWLHGSRCARGAISASAAILRRCDMPAGVRDRRPDVVDQLLLDQRVAIVDRVEDLSNRDRRRRVLPDDAKRPLDLGRNRIFHPEQIETARDFVRAGRLRSASADGGRRAAGRPESRTPRRSRSNTVGAKSR